jgi:hypothetical protein
MSTTATPRHKQIKPVERGAALLALRYAAQSHPHAGIRPHNPHRGEDRRSEGLRIPPTNPPAKGFNPTMDEAAENWPDANTWDVIGADNIDPIDGSFLLPRTYGSFETFDPFNAENPNHDEAIDDSLGEGPGT